MAHYTRFEMFLPVVYQRRKRDAQTRELLSDPITGTVQKERKALPDALLGEFMLDACAKFDGVTQANPLAPALYKGWWQKDPTKSIVIDHLTFLFGLVRIDQSDEALVFFNSWKQRFKTELEQDIV